MKKIIIISIALLALTACESKQVEEVKASSNQSYPVEKLFTVDGITVYRFRDNDPLRDPEDIGGIDSNRTALFVFNNGQIYRGCTDGEVDDDGDFCLSKKDTHHRIGLPFDRLLGWAYEKEG